jgi:lipoprotein-releasing system ATP-binding protein
MNSPVALEARSLSYSINKRLILDRVDVTIRRGESLAVVGPSGTGKTTLLMCLAGINSPSRGDVLVGGRSLAQMTARERAGIRLNSIGLVYQFGELLPELSPLENVALPALLAGANKNDAYTRSAGLLDDLNIGNVANTDTEVLSGGERQRVAVARALVLRPAVILADEPTGSLDRKAAGSVADLLFGLPRRYGCSLVIVTHNDDIAERADSLVELGIQTQGSAKKS